MIRVRIGRRWKRERGECPVDSIGLELDGVDLLAGASEEPLAKVVPDLVEALHRLVVEGSPVEQVSFSEAHLEVGLVRRGAEVDVAVVSLSRPARLTRPPVRVDLVELAEAAARCGRALVKDLSEGAPALLRSTRHRLLLRQMDELELRAVPEPCREIARGGHGYRHEAAGAVSFGFELLDPGDLLLGLQRGGRGALVSLLCGGDVYLRLGDEVPWRAAGTLFLLVLELSRQAMELSHAIELEESAFVLAPGGTAPEARVDLRGGRLEVQGKRHPVEPAALVAAMFDLGLAFAFAVVSRNKAQAKNPYIQELVARCREGLSHVRAVDPPREGPPARGARKGGTAGRPLATSGRLRRLRFTKLWEKQGLGGEEPGGLLLGREGPIFSSEEMACGFTARGGLVFRRIATHGVAASREGIAVCASGDRVLGFFGREASARWLRSHDGLPVGPLLLRRQGLLIAPSEGRAAIAFSEMTGREVWRSSPPRTQRAFLAVQGHRVLLATDSGYLHGLDLQDGQLRYRLRTWLPFLGPPVSAGRRLVATLGRKEHFALLAVDAHSGKVHWTRELTLASTSQPLAIAGRIAVTGEQDGDGVLLCFSAAGAELWRRRLHLGRGPYHLLAVGRQILVASRTGAATMVDPGGEVRWHLGASGDPLPYSVAPVAARGVLILPGEQVRAVDPWGGSVLAKVVAGSALCGLQADGKLNLYLLDEHGGLGAYQLSTHLAVLRGEG